MDKVKIYESLLNADHAGDLVRCVNCGKLMLVGIGDEFCPECGSDNLMFYDDNRPEWTPGELKSCEMIII